MSWVLSSSSDAVRLPRALAPPSPRVSAAGPATSPTTAPAHTNPWRPPPCADDAGSRCPAPSPWRPALAHRWCRLVAILTAWRFEEEASNCCSWSGSTEAILQSCSRIWIRSKRSVASPGKWPQLGSTHLHSRPNPALDSAIWVFVLRSHLITNVYMSILLNCSKCALIVGSSQSHSQWKFRSY